MKLITWVLFRYKLASMGAIIFWTAKLYKYTGRYLPILRQLNPQMFENVIVLYLLERSFSLTALISEGVCKSINNITRWTEYILFEKYFTDTVEDLLLEWMKDQNHWGLDVVLICAYAIYFLKAVDI